MVTTIAATLFFYSHRAKALTEKDTVVLADFTNRMGEPVFDGTHCGKGWPCIAEVHSFILAGMR